MLKSKSSKIMGHSHCNRGTDIADTLVFLIRFPVRVDFLMCSDPLVKKMAERLSIISNLAVATSVAVNYSRMIFFSRKSLHINKLPSLQVDPLKLSK